MFRLRLGSMVAVIVAPGRNLGFFKHGLGFGVESEADLLGLFGKENRVLSWSELHKERSWLFSPDRRWQSLLH